jgi:hypothetical protein
MSIAIFTRIFSSQAVIEKIPSFLPLSTLYPVVRNSNYWRLWREHVMLLLVVHPLVGVPVKRTPGRLVLINTDYCSVSSTAQWNLWFYRINIKTCTRLLNIKTLLFNYAFEGWSRWRIPDQPQGWFILIWFNSIWLQLFLIPNVKEGFLSFELDKTSKKWLKDKKFIKKKLVQIYLP